MDILGVPQDAWFPVCTLLLGAIGKGLGDVLGDRRRDRREAQARKEARLDVQRARHAEFQRETLLQLQEAIYDLGRLAGRVNFADVIAEHELGTWGKKDLPAEVNDGFLLATVKTQKFRVRAASADIREMGAQFVNACTQVSMARARADSDNALKAAMSIFEKLNERIGDALSALDVEEARVE